MFICSWIINKKNFYYFHNHEVSLCTIKMYWKANWVQIFARIICSLNTENFTGLVTSRQPHSARETFQQSTGRSWKPWYLNNTHTVFNTYLTTTKVNNPRICVTFLLLLFFGINARPRYLNKQYISCIKGELNPKIKFLLFEKTLKITE